jgi:hypothetical protein
LRRILKVARFALAFALEGGGLRDATFSAFAFTSPLTIQLLVHLSISTLPAGSGLIFRIAFYVLLKLAVVPGPYTVVDAQELDESDLPTITFSRRLKNLSSGGSPRKAGGEPAMTLSNVLR